jgi:hypothetical protein
LGKRNVYLAIVAETFFGPENRGWQMRHGGSGEFFSRSVHLGEGGNRASGATSLVANRTVAENEAFASTPRPSIDQP